MVTLFMISNAKQEIIHYSNLTPVYVLVNTTLGGEKISGMLSQLTV